MRLRHRLHRLGVDVRRLPRLRLRPGLVSGLRALRYTEFGDPSVLHVSDAPEPEAGPGQLRIAVRAAAVNPFDCKKRSGAFGGDLPLIPGFDAAGVAEDTGERVFGHAVGGACAERAVLAHWARMPDGLGFEEAAGFVTPAETSVRALDLVHVGTGMTVVIVGAAGGVGTAAVQIARARGARVIGTGRETSHDHLRAIGAEPITHDALAALDEPVDAGFDTAGRGAVRELIALCGDPRRVVTIADWDAGDLGVHLTTKSSAWHALGEVARLYAEGRFTMPVAEVFALEDAAEAHRLSETGHVRGKVILRI